MNTKQPIQNRIQLTKKKSGIRDKVVAKQSSLEEFAAHLARQLKVTQVKGRGFSIINRLHRQMNILQSAKAYFAKVKGTQPSLSYTAEWLLDNFYIIEQAVRHVIENMPIGFYKRLPKLDPSMSSGVPRVYELAYQYTQYCQSYIELDSLIRYIIAFQKIQVLRIGELWALPTMLRFCILENLAQTINGITSEEITTLEKIFVNKKNSLTTPTQEMPSKKSGLAIKDIQQSGDTVTPEMVVANCILSLRMLATQDWKVFFEKVSLVDQKLREDPARVYGKMDFETRNHYRTVIERFSLISGREEIAIAEDVVQLAEIASKQNHQINSDRTSHVGYYLLDSGQIQLEQRLGYQIPWTTRFKRCFFNNALGFYLGSAFLITIGISIGFFRYAFVSKGTWLEYILAASLALIISTTAAFTVINYIVTQTIPPRLLPRLEFKKEIPSKFRTMVVTPAIFTDEEDVNARLHQLELLYLANMESNLHFVLLSDFPDASEQHLPGEAKLLEFAKRGIQDLNAKYGQHKNDLFYLFHRDRIWNPSENCWMGWERKRGKLVQLNQLLRNKNSKDAQIASYDLMVGDLSILSQVKYVITLDADTALLLGSASRMIATMAHPLNQAEFDTVSGALVSGYTVLQPRVKVEPNSANASLFSRVFSPDSGVDLYSHAVSDVYQDLFGEGNYFGKGIYDVDAFERSLEGRVPENTLVSHDLFEGIHGRVGSVSDIVIYEDFPSHCVTYMQRLHRWVRGDWQLIPWLFPHVPDAYGKKISSDLSDLDHWKILDNLRQSLTIPSIFLMFAMGWLLHSASTWLWTATALLPLLLPVLIYLHSELLNWLRTRSLASLDHSIKYELLRAIFRLIFIPYQALVILDAITTTIVRLFITRKRLLQWTTASHSIRIFGTELRLTTAWKHMGNGVLLSLGLGILAIWINPGSIPFATPIIFLWLISPFIGTWISQPLTKKPKLLAENQIQNLRKLGRRTWLFFERFVGPDDHWLPPDHYQVKPSSSIAHHTSPTNIGFYLLSTISAYDLGYIGYMELSFRLQDTLDSMKRLELYRGHLLNWIDTRSLKPLFPRYVSVVDSGNLASCLLVLSQACEEICHTPILRWERMEGFLDTLNILIDISSAALVNAEEFGIQLKKIHKKVAVVKEKPEIWPALIVELCEEGECELAVARIMNKSADQVEADVLLEIHTWMDRAKHHLQNLRNEMEMLVPWVFMLYESPEIFLKISSASGDLSFPTSGLATAWQTLKNALPPSPSLIQISDICKEAESNLVELIKQIKKTLKYKPHVGKKYALQLEQARDWCEKLAAKLYSTRLRVGALLAGNNKIKSQVDKFFLDMNFSFLLNHDRQVFHIGYHVDTDLLDNSFYDLLTSEARLASFVAIAKADVLPSHWLHLARPITSISGIRVLLSWSGTMFEYLMPSLIMQHRPGTLLYESCKAAVNHQIVYGKQKGVPWGVSESSYYYFDEQMKYQYQAFGVPGLGLKRGLADKLVVSPYASLLALSLRPQAVIENIAHLNRLQVNGLYGFYEAIDFTPLWQAGLDSAIIYSYMAHHQGMILLALVNYLKNNVMINRMHRDPRVQSNDLLLQEQPANRAPLEYPHQEEVGKRALEETVLRVFQLFPALTPWHPEVNNPVPQVHCLSNGRYNLLLTNTGGGYSRWQDIHLTRWRSDTTLDQWGSWIYIQDIETGEFWLPQRQPSDVLFYPHKIEYQCSNNGIRSHVTVTIAPKEDVEIRRLTLTNHSTKTRRLALTSFAEIAMATKDEDGRHPGFYKLFIESEYLPKASALLFRRRLVSSEEAPIFLAHFSIYRESHSAPITFETDRLKFIGRGKTHFSPKAFDLKQINTEKSQNNRQPLSCSIGATLDPCMAIRQEFILEPHSSMQAAFITLVAESRQNALELIDQYQSWPSILQCFNQAQENNERELSRLNLTSSEIEQAQKLLSALIYPHISLRSASSVIAANTKGQSSLWLYSISGDYPILLLKIGNSEGTTLVHELLKVHSYWRSQQMKVDLVFLNLRDTGYKQDLQGHLKRLISQAGADIWLNRRGGIFLLQADRMKPDEITLLETAARVILDDSKGALNDQLVKMEEVPSRLPHFIPTKSIMPEEETQQKSKRPKNLLFDNGLGGFSPDGREYIIYLKTGQLTPVPWINVIANQSFGCLVSESGMGCTWAINSGSNRLTPWRNDPVTDLPSEALYLRDEDTGQVWTPTPIPTPDTAPYLVRHGAGYSIFEHESNGLKQKMKVFVPPNDPLKIVLLRLENIGKQPRRIMATYFAEWVLGSNREAMAQFITPEFDGACRALLASNPYNEEFGQRVAFLAATQEPHSLTTDRTEFLGRLGNYQKPSALDRIGLAAKVEAGLDPCAALSTLIWLLPGETKEIAFILGQGKDRDDAVQIIRQYQDNKKVSDTWITTKKYWDQFLGQITVDTPDPAANILMNRWLLYQTLSCRLWGRSALYQSSGAFGFRDQLQDVLALLYTDPEIARNHILEAAAHQFKEGDVLHWWHPPSDRGMRTRCSDDLLWLSYVASRYVQITNDFNIMNEQIPYLEGKQLDDGEMEHYGSFIKSKTSGSLFEHCCRALDIGTTSGPHKLPLIKSGDWNDGLNRVGIKGQGESVWLGWFLASALSEFSDLCKQIGDHQHANIYRFKADEIRYAIEANAWDGNWYLRGYYDNGATLGSVEDEECQIDSIAQSWAVLSGLGDQFRCVMAMDAVARKLIKMEDSLVLLFTPPFEKTYQDPGYIKGYPPGVRENGGQYTHAAIWVAWAYAKLGQGDRLGELLSILNPIYHADTLRKTNRYCVEPYVIAADIYSTQPYIGRGGWTWYTGSSGWMYRLYLEACLGLNKSGNVLQINPCIPKTWTGYSITYRHGKSIYRIRVENPDGFNIGVKETTVDGKMLSNSKIPLVDDGEQHEVYVRLGK